MRRIVALLAVVLWLAPATASGGGWAVASLDPLTPVRAGSSVEVGFRLLQHGRTPVVAADWPAASIGLDVRVNDREVFVPAVADGDPGHFVATVDVPVGATSVALRVQMQNGLYVDDAWTPVAIGVAGGGDGWLPSWSAPLFALAAAVCAAALAVDVRRRRARAASAATVAAA